MNVKKDGCDVQWCEKVLGFRSSKKLKYFTLFQTVTANEKVKCDLLTNVGGIVAGLY